MKQKIVIKVPMDCEKCRSKALKIAVVAKGAVISSVSLEGDDRDQVVVIGDGIDSVCLARALRKKFGHANIVKVEEVKEKEEEKEEEKVPLLFSPCPPYVVCEDDQYGSGCIVM